MSSPDTARELALLREELARFASSAAGQAIEPAGRTVTKSELVRGLLAHLTKAGGEHSTVKIGRNAQGQATFEVSVRTGESDAIATAADASAEALRLWLELDELLPFVKAEPASSTRTAAKAAAIASSAAKAAGGA